MPRTYEDAFTHDVEPALDAEDRALRDTIEEDFGFASQLAMRRRELGLTQAQIAERAGMTQADVSRLERGLGNPTSDKLDRIAAALGMRVQRKLVSA